MSERATIVLLDFGGILYGLDYPRMHRAFDALSSGVGYARLRDAGFGELCERFEVGALSPSDFRGEIASMLGHAVESESIDRAYNAVLDGLFVEAPDFVRRLGQRHRVALVSNTNAIHASGFLPECESFLTFFDRVYLSHELGLRKPNPSIYTTVLDDLGASASSCVFVDDLEENREGARSVGIRSVAWRTNQGIAGLEDAIEAAFRTKS